MASIETRTGPRGTSYESLRERFWANVQKSDGCWEWTGHIVELGYGRFNPARAEAGTYYAHRMVFHFSDLPMPPRGKVVDHLCRNRRCVNPDHLRIVSQSENTQNLSGPRRGSKTGVRGVVHSHTRKDGTPMYQAWTSVGGVNRHLGTFASLAEAKEVADVARVGLYAVPGSLSGATDG